MEKDGECANDGEMGGCLFAWSKMEQTKAIQQRGFICGEPGLKTPKSVALERLTIGSLFEDAW